MKTRRLHALIVLGGLPALLGGPLCGIAWAQSPADDQTQLRSIADARPVSTATLPGQEEAPDDTAQDTPDDAANPDGIPEPDTLTSERDVDPNAAADAAALRELRRQNPRYDTVDGLRPAQEATDELTPGIRAGSFILRPSVSESLGVERRRDGKDTLTRSYLQTGLKGSLTSDWSLHELRIDSEGTWDKTLSGTPEDDPEGKVDAALRLDVTDATKVNLRAGFSMQREDISAANAVADATNQALVSTYTASAEATHDLGVIRATAGLDFEREVYGDAQLDNGQTVSQQDRDQNTGTIRGRLGYELSQAIIPFVEASYSRSIYDRHKDSLGYVRDAQIYELRSGVEGDFGDKLRGEISGGYALAEFDDSRLKSISALTLDGKAVWSPQRGTDVELGLNTEIEPSTSAGASGDVAYTANVALTQAIIDTLKGSLTGAYTLRRYSDPASADQNVVNLGAGLTWGLSRSIDLTANVAWEKSTQSGVSDSDTFTALMGVALKR